ncbi:MAG: hypothetical protein J5689_00400 [Clostridia bacterium]|nr:hypothetical protein [Clostridia bacterium]
MIVNNKNLSFDAVFGLAEDMVYIKYLKEAVAKNNELKEASKKEYKKGLSSQTKLSNKDLDKYFEKKKEELSKHIENLVKDYNAILRVVERKRRIEKENKELRNCEISTEINEGCIDYLNAGYYGLYKKLVDKFDSVSDYKKEMQGKTISFDKEEPYPVGGLKVVAWQVLRDVIYCYGVKNGYLVTTDSKKFDYDNEFGRSYYVKGLAFVGRDYAIEDAKVFARAGLETKVKETPELLG